MATITKNIDGKDVNIELTEDELLEHTKNNKGLIQKLREILKIDEPTKGEDKKEVVKKEERKVDNSELENLKAEMAKLKAERQADLKSQSEKSARIKESKTRKLIEQAISDGKIAKGESETLLKKYKENPNYLVDYLEARKPDPVLKKQNTATPQTDEEKKSGVKVFRMDEIKDMPMEEYAKHEKAIHEALSKNNILK